MNREGAIAVELAQGRLSPDEDRIGGSVVAARREQLETFLYEHLAIAARARLRIDASRSWSHEYHLDYRAREIALEAASRHYRALTELGGIEPLLAQMAKNEGLAP
jgi:hypothetical protein